MRVGITLEDFCGRSPMRAMSCITKAMSLKVAVSSSLKPAAMSIRTVQVQSAAVSIAFMTLMTLFLPGKQLVEARGGRKYVRCSSCQVEPPEGISPINVRAGAHVLRPATGT